jgi:superfamily II DNA or RNA helicase
VTLPELACSAATGLADFIKITAAGAAVPRPADRRYVALLAHAIPPRMPTSLSPALTPHGVLYLATAADAAPLPDALSQRLSAAFAHGPGPGLLQLGAAEVNSVLPPAFAYFRDLAQRYVTAVCLLPDEPAGARASELAPPDSEALVALAQAGPPIPGGEYLNAEVLETLWRELDSAFLTELASSKLSREEFLKRKNPAWNLVGRVHFNLAENRKSEETPFAFLATYTTRLSANAKAQHLPLGRALEEYAGSKHKAQLLSLLLPVQRAAEKCAWLRALVDDGEIYHPLRWTPAEAFALLQDVPSLEAAGVVVRVPGTWRGNRPARPKISASVGGKAPAAFGQDALLDFRMEVSLDGEALTPAEISQLLASSEGLALLRGRWVEVQPDKLHRMLDEFRALERAAADGGIDFGTAMRLLAGANVTTDGVDTQAAPDWSQVSAGQWLAETLRGLRSPESLARVTPGSALRATLRPYQEIGVRWLHLLSQLRLGACLADDMGLGKTIQVLALLLLLKNDGAGASLLVAPASLLANWVAELERFAPSLRALVVHPSTMTPEQLQTLDATLTASTDLVITSYGTLLRQPALTTARWRLLVLDEAQAIKNPSAKQTRIVKKLAAEARIALTGTPVENRLADLWSIFDFTNPGLLGTSKEFTAFTKRLSAQPHNPYGPLRELVRPYILRRLKTDKTVISDLPDKTEQKAFCQLSRKQAALYEQAVRELKSELANAEGIQRKGLVLSMLMRMKQICNHPSQWLGDGGWQEADSGKLLRLRELTEVIADKQEKVLVFTQFRETTAPLAAFLGDVFGRPGLVLHGETAVKQRKNLVERFQNDETVPFFVLSLKAGGSGLNLTAASHVIHFDRWWNPAVENQATDRAFRIGQTKNVLVHKFVCRGTVEEKIDQLIESKRQLSTDLLEVGAEQLLTELDDAALLQLVALDIHSALTES